MMDVSHSEGHWQAVEPLFNMGPLNSCIYFIGIFYLLSHIYNKNGHIKVKNQCWFSVVKQPHVPQCGTSRGLVLVLAGSCLASCWPWSWSCLCLGGSDYNTDPTGHLFTPSLEKRTTCFYVMLTSLDDTYQSLNN